MNVSMDGGSPATSIERIRAVLTSRGGERGGRGLSMPLVIGIGAGLRTLAIMVASAGRDELV